MFQTTPETDEEVDTEFYTVMEEDANPIDYLNLTVEGRAVKQKEYNETAKKMVKNESSRLVFIMAS